MTKKEFSYKKEVKKANKKKADKLYDKPLVAYKSGNSTVVTIPAVFGIKPGDVLEIKTAKGENEIYLKKVSDESSKAQKLKEVERLSGILDIPWLKDMSPEELDVEIDKMYDD